MSEITFGTFLRDVRKRQNGSELAKNSGISYVYLIDIEKGARPVPKKQILQALAANLKFFPGEKDVFFDLAAKEKGDIPVDVGEVILKNKRLTEILRRMKTESPSEKCWEKIEKSIFEAIKEDRGNE